ncbi:hypothetical protein BCR32DRAFT_267757 [Anaeromyces robustus]|uniref:HAD-like protein n=1 Tax=Anaeromyces robustus TaxID=1754192 RepID=A0A1Y1X951_9FUNG|nr:hypothetical protein BCR32DRAFT_267757 [Anaeromyces robustus]|eukprot:ORX82265.1 hypothetical protein BCR32DRAFT_267757 [Anaeromyces robustus]
MEKVELPNVSKIKLIATDIDGTLLNKEGKITERTKTVICKILEKYPDLHFVLASGRSFPGTLRIREELNILKRPNTESLLNNGTIVYDPVGSIIWQNALPKEFIIKFVSNPLSNIDYAFSAGDDAITFSKKWAEIMEKKFEEKTIIMDKKEFIKKVADDKIIIDRASVLVQEKEKEEIENFKKEFESIRQEYNVKCTFYKPYFLDYTQFNSHKGAGLTYLNKKLNIQKDEVIAFGDGDNDLELLQNSGWPVVMANACEELKPYGKLTTKSNKEDGVADMLERIFLKDQMN